MKKTYISRLWRLMLLCCIAITSQARTAEIEGYTPRGSVGDDPLFSVNTPTITVSPSSNGWLFNYVYIDGLIVATSSYSVGSYSLDITRYLDGNLHKIELKNRNNVSAICYLQSLDGCFIDGIYYYTRNANGAVVEWVLSDIKNAVIHEKCTHRGVTYPVVAISAEAFKGLTELRSVAIPNSVTTIGDHAFSRCKGLTELTIPNSVTTIGNYAFSECTGLTELTILNSVTTIGNYAFIGCTGLTELTIPNSVTTIGDDAFWGCTGLTELTIPNSVTTIGNHAFSGCKGLTELTIPNSVTTIADHAFSECKGLTELTIPNSVTTIGNYAFGGCTGLTELTIPNSVTTIGESAFWGCTGLTELTIPNSVTTIGYHAFWYCTGLTELTIPNSVTTIADGAFYGCTGLTEVTIPNSVIEIKYSAFSGCTGLTEVIIGDHVKYIYTGAFSSCPSINSVTSLNPTPPSLSSDELFSNTNITLHVPEGCKSAYLQAEGWREFFSIIDDAGTPENLLSEKKEAALNTYKTATDVYEQYMPYYNGNGMEYYKQTIDKYGKNANDTDVIMYDIEQLKKYVTESELSNEEIDSYITTLNTIKESMTTLKAENGGVLAENSFLDKVQEHYENVVAFNGRLAQYKESVEAATTLKELDSIIAEIEQDAKNVESSYLQPVIEEYSELENIATRLVQISEELEKCKSQLQTCSDEIDSSIESLIAVRKANANKMLKQSITVYEKYMSYYDGEGMEYYNRIAEKKDGNSNDAEYLLDDIEQLDKKLLESGMSEEDMIYYIKALNAMKENVTTLKGENNNILVDNFFHDKVLEYYENVVTFHGRLERYKDSVESATTLKELNTLIVEIEQDVENIESSYLKPVVNEYMGLESIETRLVQISGELANNKIQLQSYSDEINASSDNNDNDGDNKGDNDDGNKSDDDDDNKGDDENDNKGDNKGDDDDDNKGDDDDDNKGDDDTITTQIESVVNTESEYIVVYTLNGLPHSVKKDELMSLPQGIYIVNGKTVLIK